MSLKERVVDRNRRHVEELAWQRAAASPRNSNFGVGAVAVLSAINQVVAFYDDRLEYRRRLGAKHGVIAYDDLKRIHLAKKPTDVNGVIAIAKHLTTGPSGTTIVLNVRGRRTPRIFEFRDESPEVVRVVFETMKEHMKRAAASDVDADADETTVSPDVVFSRADELAKLADLRRTGVLSQEEFEREKARILNS